MALLKKICDALDRLSGFICALMILSLTALVVVNTALRFLFELNLLWAYDVCRVLFMFFVFFAAAVVYRRGLHAKFVFIEERLPKTVARVIRTLFHVMYLFIFAVISLSAGKLSWSARMQVQPASGLSAGLYYLPLCLAFLICLFFTVEFLANDLGFKTKAKEAAHE